MFRRRIDRQYDRIAAFALFGCEREDTVTAGLVRGERLREFAEQVAVVLPAELHAAHRERRLGRVIGCVPLGAVLYGEILHEKFGVASDGRYYLEYIFERVFSAGRVGHAVFPDDQLSGIGRYVRHERFAHDQFFLAVVVRCFDNQRIGCARCQIDHYVPMLSGRCKFFHRIGIEFFTVFIDYILQGQASGLNLDIVDYGSFVEVGFDLLHLRAGDLVHGR